jgi:hypothetical protein
MKASIAAVLMIGLMGCSNTDRSRSAGILSDCDQATAEQQAPGKCMVRPVLRDEKTPS